MQAAEAALQEFKEKEGLVSIDERRTLLEQKLKDLGGALTAAKTRRLQKEALYGQMQAASNPEELPGAMESPLIQGLRAELAQLERQGAQLAAKGFLDQHPEAVRLNGADRGHAPEDRARGAPRRRAPPRTTTPPRRARRPGSPRRSRRRRASRSSSRSGACATTRSSGTWRRARRWRTSSWRARSRPTWPATSAPRTSTSSTPRSCPHEPVRPRPVRDMGLAAAARPRLRRDGRLRPRLLRHLGGPPERRAPPRPSPARRHPRDQLPEHPADRRPGPAAGAVRGRLPAAARVASRPAGHRAGARSSSSPRRSPGRASRSPRSTSRSRSPEPRSACS